MLEFWTISGLWRRGHGLIAGALCGICLIAFAVACITDINHPPGTRTIRLSSIIVVLLISGIEYLWAWRGLSLFAFLWPQQLLLKYVLARNASPLLGYLPEIFDWPCAAGFALAIVLRQLRTIPPTPLPKHQTEQASISNLVPLVFYIFSILTALSAIYGWIKLSSAPGSWNVQAPNYRYLLSVGNPLSIMRLAWVGIPLIVNTMLAILLLRSVVFERNTASKSNIPLLAFAASMVIAGLIVISQVYGQWKFPFDDGPPGGPFSHRNGVAPMLFLAATVAASSSFTAKKHSFRLLGVFFALLLFGTSIATGSRNIIFMIMGLIWAIMLTGSRIRYAIAATLLPAIVLLAVIFLAPLPRTENTGVLSRSINTITNLREGNWDQATSYRNQLWKSAFNIWKENPILGSGPGTFYLFITQVPGTRHESLPEEGVARIVPHSTPITLLSENGVFGAISWSFLWIVVPIAWVLKSKRFEFLIIGLLLYGVSNIFDTPWYVLGGMTMAALWFSAASFRIFSQSHIPMAK